VSWAIDQMPSDVPEGAVNSDPAQWQELYALYANAGLAHDEAQRVFTGLDWSLADGPLDPAVSDALNSDLLAAGVPTVYQLRMSELLAGSGRQLIVPVATPA
jgi:hypothetical protein